MAMMPLSCGHTLPHWYEYGLKHGWSADSVRMPQPLHMSGAISRATTRAARSGGTMPDHRQCPMLEATVNTAFFSPSRQ